MLQVFLTPAAFHFTQQYNTHRMQHFTILCRNFSFILSLQNSDIVLQKSNRSFLTPSEFATLVVHYILIILQWRRVSNASSLFVTSSLPLDTIVHYSSNTATLHYSLPQFQFYIVITEQRYCFTKSNSSLVFNSFFCFSVQSYVSIDTCTPTQVFDHVNSLLSAGLLHITAYSLYYVSLNYLLRTFRFLIFVFFFNFFRFFLCPFFKWAVNNLKVFLFIVICLSFSFLFSLQTSPLNLSEIQLKSKQLLKVKHGRKKHVFE